MKLIDALRIEDLLNPKISWSMFQFKRWIDRCTSCLVTSIEYLLFWYEKTNYKKKQKKTLLLFW